MENDFWTRMFTEANQHLLQFACTLIALIAIFYGWLIFGPAILEMVRIETELLWLGVLHHNGIEMLK